MNVRLTRFAGWIPVILAFAACEQNPTAPEAFEPAPDAAMEASTPATLLRTTNGETALRWTEGLEKDVQKSEGLNEEGGDISIDPGIELLVPKGALSEKTEITVLSRRGNDVAFEFGPHGLEFDRPVTVRIALEKLENRYQIMEMAEKAESAGHADGMSVVKLGSIKAVYYALQNGEMVEVLQEFTVYVVGGKYLQFQTDHFSGYALAA